MLYFQLCSHTCFKGEIQCEKQKITCGKGTYCTLSLCYDCGPSRTAYLPPSLHYSHHSAKWRQTGIDSVWVQRPTAFTRRGLEHLDMSLGPIFLSLSISQIDSNQNLITCFIAELLTSCKCGCSFPKNSWTSGGSPSLQVGNGAAGADEAVVACFRFLFFFFFF